MSGQNETNEISKPQDMIDATRYVRQTKADNKLLTNFEDFQVKESAVTGLDEWVGVDEVRATAEAQAYVNQYASFTDMNKELAYKDFKSGDIVSMLEPDGSRKQYRVEPLEIRKDTPGIAGVFVFKPLETPAGQIPTVKVAFRGTKTLADWQSNAERNGPGADSFALNRDSFVRQINGALAEYDKVNVVVGGHSRGAALASYCTAAIREAAAQNIGFEAAHSTAEENRNHFSKIQKLTITGNNGAGINKDTANHNAQVVKYLAEHARTDGTKIVLENYKMRRDGDGVQQTGETELDADVPPEHVVVDVMKVHGSKNPVMSPMEAGLSLLGGAAASIATGGILPFAGTAIGLTGHALKALANTGDKHCTNIFDNENSTKENSSKEKPTEKKPPAVYTFEQLSNRKDPKAVSKQLNNKSGWLNTIRKGAFMFADGVATVLSGVSGIFGKLGSPFSRTQAQTTSQVRAAAEATATLPTTSQSDSHNKQAKR